MAKPAILPSAYTAFPHVPHSRSVLENHASFSSAPAPFAAARIAAGASNSQYTHERSRWRELGQAVERAVNRARHPASHTDLRSVRTVFGQERANPTDRLGQVIRARESDDAQVVRAGAS